MAQSKKTSKSKTTKSKSAAKPEDRPVRQTEEPVVPHRRELGAVLFLFLAIVVIISYFVKDGAFVNFFSELIQGLVGWGYWLTAPALLLVAAILAFHRGRPVSLRVSCALLLPMLVASIMSLMMYEAQTEGVGISELTAKLFDQGQSLDSAGVLGGLAAIGLESALSRVGALVLLIILLAACTICAFDFNVHKAAQKVVERAQTKYDPSMYDLPLESSKSENATVPQSTRRQAARVEKLSRATVLDIPMGESMGEAEADEVDADIEALFRQPVVPKVRPVRTPRPKKTAPTTEEPSYAPEELTAAPVVPAVKPMGERKTVVTVIPRTETVSTEISDPPKGKKISRSEVDAEAQAFAEAISCEDDLPDYEYPPVTLLRSSDNIAVDAHDEIELNRERLEGAIRSFGISAGIVGVTRGPTVTRYDVELDQGVKLSRITNLAGDLALALGVVNVRIAPIPEKISTVGIEVPNKIVSTVYLRDIIDTPKFASAKSKLSFALGKDIGGEGIIGNIAKLPHLLIAGTTGSGKSVCMNSLILSLLYKARPDEVRLIMIDPKMVELGVYNGIPHLYVPVVTDPKKAAGALQWSVVEMLKRYRLFSEVGVRDLENYNKHCLDNGEETMPRVVIVIDELADLMLVASKEVEESICRVAQMGRAAGMHLVIATQRPSADVITGLMKANIPSRIAFAVSSTLESRIILDQGGAEKLIGMGDMLFSPVGVGKPIRIQGAYVSDEEREEVIQFIKDGAGTQNGNSEIEDFMNKAAESKSDGKGSKEDKDEDALGDYDELLPKAVEAVLEMKSCSASMLQRRVKLGYARAARIVDQMEELGIVGPYEGAKPRQVIIDHAGWIELQKQLGMAVDESVAAEEEFPADGDSYEE